MSKFYDISVPMIDDATKVNAARIEYFDHKRGAALFGPNFHLDPAALPDGQFVAIEYVKAPTHAATHMDAPYHYWPTSEGKPSLTIDEVPLEWCYGDGVVLDVTHKKAAEFIDVDDLREALRRIDYTIKPGDIALIRTDVTTKHYPETGYESLGPGLSRAATLWLIGEGVRVIGIDTFSLDRPMDVMAAEFNAGQKETFFAAHWVGRDRTYLQIENLWGLDRLPRPFGFKVAAFPIKIAKASGAWVRAVAIFD